MPAVPLRQRVALRPILGARRRGPSVFAIRVIWAGRCWGRKPLRGRMRNLWLSTSPPTVCFLPGRWARDHVSLAAAPVITCPGLLVCETLVIRMAGPPLHSQAHQMRDPAADDCRRPLRFCYMPTFFFVNFSTVRNLGETWSGISGTGSLYIIPCHIRGVSVVVPGRRCLTTPSSKGLPAGIPPPLLVATLSR